MRISAAIVWTLWSFFAHQIADGITVRPGEISITNAKPRAKMPHKLNKTIDSESLLTSADNRIRRLIPYMSYYHPGNDYNYLPEYLPVHPGVMLRKKPSPQIPSIAYLYGGGSSKYAQRPAVQAGFIYKARPDPYKTYSHVQPQMQPSYNTYKYQPLNSAYQPSIAHKSIVTSDKSHYTPFMPANKLPGEFVPIFKSKNLPYKFYDEKVTSADDVSFPPQAHHEHMMKPLDEDEFIPMTPSPSAHYHKTKSQPISNHLFHSKLISSSEQQSNHVKPITYSTPSPVFITTTESNQPFPPSYEYYQPATTPSQDYRPVKVTTFAPDEKYLQTVKVLTKKKFVHHGDVELESNSVPEILTKLQKSNHLPETLTPDNVDNSIKTLVKILNNIKQKEQVVHKLPPKLSNHAGDDYDYNNDDDDTVRDGSPGPNSGRPGIDYPIYHDIPETAFTCKDQRYKGFFGDPETSCQVWHYCDLNGGKASFLCPNGTVFSQVALTCDWWFNVKCSNTPQLYVLNERLYKYILPFTPKFPEDYSGPLVDKYLAIKFQEMEEKLKKEKEEAEAAKLNRSEEEADVVKDVDNEVEELPSESVDKIHTVESAPEDDTVFYTPGPIRVPTVEVTSVIPLPSSAYPPTVSELPPIPHTVVEQERIEMVEINNDGTSGHLTHNLK